VDGIVSCLGITIYFTILLKESIVLMNVRNDSYSYLSMLKLLNNLIT